MLADDSIYQCETSDNFKPWRRRATYPKVKELEIKPFIDGLECIKNKEKWGYIFRTGFFEISQHDFDLIESHMHQ